MKINRNNTMSDFKKKLMSSAVAASLALTMMPATALAAEKTDEADASESQAAIVESESAPVASGMTETISDAADATDSTGAADDVADSKADAKGTAADVKGGADDVADKGKHDSDATLADGQEEDEEALEEGAPEMLSEEGEALEEEASDWVRPERSVRLANSKLKGGTFSVMQACTSTRLNANRDIAASIVAEPTASGSFDFASEKGVSTSALISSRGDATIVVASDDEDAPDATYSYWKTKLLSASDPQLLDGMSNKTACGDDVSRIRYNAGRLDADGTAAPSWEYTSDGSTWFAFEVGKGASQLVFYYMQVAQADDNVQISDDNWYHSLESWEGIKKGEYGYNNQDAVCFLYQIYDESGKKISTLAPTEAYYYSHALDQQVHVTLTNDLADKYEVVDVRWDQYQGYLRGHYGYNNSYYSGSEGYSSLYGFTTPERFTDLRVDPSGTSFTVGTASGITDGSGNIVGGKCSQKTHTETCRNEHWGMYVIGVMVRGVQSDQSITVEYYGNPTKGSTDPVAKLGAQTVVVAGSDGYDWDKSGYENAPNTPTKIEVVSAFKYGSENVKQTVSLTVPESFADVYSELPVTYVLEGNVLKLYFSPFGQPGGDPDPEEPVTPVDPDPEDPTTPVEPPVLPEIPTFPPTGSLLPPAPTHPTDPILVPNRPSVPVVPELPGPFYDVPELPGGFEPGDDPEVPGEPEEPTTIVPNEPQPTDPVIIEELEGTPLGSVATTAAVYTGKQDPVKLSVVDEPQGTEIADDPTPLASKFDGQGHGIFCWVHWWMLLGIIVTIVGGAVSALRRILFTDRLQDMEDDLLNDDQSRSNRPAPHPAR